MSPDFIIKVPKNTISNIPCIPIKNLLIGELEYGIYYNKNALVKRTVNEKEILIIGDLVGEAALDDIEYFRLSKLKGIFYIIIIDNQKLEVKISSCLFGILPIFIKETNKDYIISSNLELIRQKDNRSFSINKKFLIEQVLFNYSFNCDTIFNEISLIPANVQLTWSGGHLTATNVFNIADYYSPVNNYNKKKTLKNLSDLFVESTQKYLPSGRFSISFTSGFDGRTLVSIALQKKMNFNTFSFGRAENPDVIIPNTNASVLKIPYYFIDLGSEEYLNKSFPTFTKSLINSSGLYSNMIYPHFYYSAYEVSKNSEYLLTGYAGSELFRALHNIGAMVSPELYYLFYYEDKDNWIRKLKDSTKLKFFNSEILKDNLDKIIADVSDYKDSLPKEFSQNQKFYIYVFNEIIRKFFGSIIKSQFDFLTVRVPFLDFDFINELLKTNYAGVNNDFFTHNPTKRMVGQLLYAEIIKNTSLELFSMKTGKGYSPASLFGIIGKFKLAYTFVNKIIFQKNTPSNLDNLGLITGFNKLYYNNKIVVPNEYYNIDYLNEKAALMSQISEQERDIVLLLSSVGVYFDHIYNHKK